jgi:hypothetical protein
MRGISACAEPDFASLALRGLLQMEHCAADGADLSLELGLSFWIARSGASLDDARSTMMAMREALVSEAGIEMATEPTPLRWHDPRLDVINLAFYLRGLIGRAAANARNDPLAMVERALERLARQTRSARPVRALA